MIEWVARFRPRTWPQFPSVRLREREHLREAVSASLVGDPFHGRPRVGQIRCTARGEWINWLQAFAYVTYTIQSVDIYTGVVVVQLNAFEDEFIDWGALSDVSEEF